MYNNNILNWIGYIKYVKELKVGYPIHRFLPRGAKRVFQNR